MELQGSLSGRAGRAASSWGHRTQPTSAGPAGEQPDASLPLHVLPLYSLLAPEKQAQVTVWGLGWMPSRGSEDVEMGVGQALGHLPISC